MKRVDYCDMTPAEREQALALYHEEFPKRRANLPQLLRSMCRAEIILYRETRSGRVRLATPLGGDLFRMPAQDR